MNVQTSLSNVGLYTDLLTFHHGLVILVSRCLTNLAQSCQWLKNIVGRKLGQNLPLFPSHNAFEPLCKIAQVLSGS